MQPIDAPMLISTAGPVCLAAFPAAVFAIVFYMILRAALWVSETAARLATTGIRDKQGNHAPDFIRANSQRWQKTARLAALRSEVEQLESELDDKPKRKRKNDDTQFRLGDDGELVQVEEQS